MGRNTYGNVLITAVAAGMIFFAWQMLASLDRLIFAVEKLEKQIAVIENKSGFTPPRLVSPQAAQVVSGNTEEFANAEYFDPDAQEGGRLIMAISASPENLNPIICNDADLSAIVSLCGAALANRDCEDPTVFAPELAEEWQESDDHKTYHIKLKRGILWHDFTDPDSGKFFHNVEVTAGDFKFFVDVVKNPDVNCAPLRGLYAGLEKVEIINDYEFIVHWSEPFFRTRELTLSLSPLPRHLYWNYDGEFDAAKFNDDFKRNEMIVGCGPYKLHSYKRNQRLILERFDNYIGRRYGAKPALKYIVFDVVSHPNTRFQMLLAKELDELGLSPEQWVKRTNIPEFGENGFLKKSPQSRMAYFYIGWNMRKPPFGDIKVRNAMTMLVNRPKIINDVFMGLAEEISGPFYINSPYNDSSITPLPFDVKKAKELLAEAGWRDSDNNGILDKDGREFDFVLLYPADQPTYERLLTIVKEDMAKAGINMRLQSFEWSVFVQRIEARDFDAYTMGWQLAYESDPYQLWHSSQAEIPSGSNYVGFKNPEADQLIAAIRSEFDTGKRIELCNRFHQLIHEFQPYTFLAAPYQLSATARRYRNLRQFPVDNTTPKLIRWTPVSEQLKVPDL